MDITSTSATSLLNTLSSQPQQTSTNNLNGFELPVESGDEVEISEEGNLLSEEVTAQLSQALPTLMSAQTSTAILGTLGGGDANTSLIQAATFAQSNSQIQAAQLSTNSSLLNLLG